jgi:hypothetical protein
MTTKCGPVSLDNLAYNMPIVPDYEHGKGVYPGACTPIDQPPQIWETLPPRFNNNNKFTNFMVDFVEKGVESDVHNKLYKFRPTTAPMLSAAEVEEAIRLLKPGMMLLETNDANYWPDFEEGGLAKSDRWNHVAAYMGAYFNPKTKEVMHIVIEAGGTIWENVHRVDLRTFLKTHHVAIYDPHFKDGVQLRKFQEYMVSQLGKPYDARMFMSETPVKSSGELVINGVENADLGIPAATYCGPLYLSGAEFCGLKTDRSKLPLRAFGDDIAKVLTMDGLPTADWIGADIPNPFKLSKLPNWLNAGSMLPPDYMTAVIPSLTLVWTNDPKDMTPAKARALRDERYKEGARIAKERSEHESKVLDAARRVAR